MNTRAKGRRIEKEVEDFLKNNGYSTYRAKMLRYGQKDIFGLFDIVALKYDQRGNPFGVFLDRAPLVVFVQVKSNISDYYKACDEVRKFYREFVAYRTDDVGFAVFLRKEKGRYRVFMMLGNYERTWHNVGDKK